ncbi:MAG: aldehyde dehydrogenase EutE [Tissierellia bacterium]|nr:aldehyde dehydrogenase EutE [Tissierellia bacterium]
MRVNENLVDCLVKEVMNSLEDRLEKEEQAGGDGVFKDVNEAVAAAKKAQEELFRMTLSDRKRITDAIRQDMDAYVEELSRRTVEETGMGRLEDKIQKNRVALKQTPGIEDLPSYVYTGDRGLTLLELSPFGVIGSITPSTNPTETVFCNAIGMICAGNSVVFSPHPGAYKVTNYTVELINKAIVKAGGPKNLVVTLNEPSLEKSNTLMAHPDIRMLVATGGPAIVKTVLSSGKKAIGAGAGNPPALVDQTANIEKAVKDIVAGCSFDNNLPCTSEKEAIVVDEVFEYFVFNMKHHPETYFLEDPAKIEALKELVVKEGKPNKAFTGKDASYILGKIGIEADKKIKLISCVTDFDHPFVQLELLMPILPIVRAENRESALNLALKAEHGNRHTATCHSRDIEFLSKAAKEMQTTIFVKNAPSFAGLGIGGEGYTTFTIAGPTGEGLTSTKSFCRHRRCSLVDGFNIR